MRARPPRSGRRCARLALVAAALLVAASCSDGDEAAPTTTTGLTSIGGAADVGTTVATSGGTDVATTAAAPTTSIAPTTTSLAPTSTTTTTITTTPTTTTTTTPVETLPPTTATPSSGPCDLATVVAQTETGFDGIQPQDLRCSGSWAAWLGAAIDPATTDSFFAVASWDGAAWVLANLGTASVCTDAGVPASLWPALGCTE